MPQQPQTKIQTLNQSIAYCPTDSRYRVAYGYFGYSAPMLGVWFTYELIGVCHNELGAERVVLAHQKERQSGF